MIEIYLATLLFGLGSMYNNSQKKPQQINTNNANNDSNPYNQQLLKKVKKVEKEIGLKLENTKYKTILPRQFSNILDDETSKLLYEDEKILKYKPKNNNKIKSSLTGTDLNLDQFITSKTIGRDKYDDVTTKTWAIPYFKGTAKQNMKLDGYQNKLDIHTGRSEFNFHKKETNNFFKPSKDVSFINGSPNVNNKIEDRYAKSNNRTCELPFEQIKVASGLGQSYGSKGKGGFHQFDINDIARPKTIDELRTLSNPRKTYSQPVQTGKSTIDKRASSAKVVKHRVPKTFHQSKKDFIAPKSAINKESNRPKIIVRAVNKRHKEYSGHAAPASKVNPANRAGVKKDTKNIYNNPEPNNPARSGSWTVKNPNDIEGGQSSVKLNDDIEGGQSSVKLNDDFDISSYGKSGIKLPPNERDTTQKKTVINNLTSIIKAIIAPVNHKMKQTKKENIEGNPNISGYMAPNFPNKLTVYDPNDIARTTIKETTEDNNHQGNIHGPKKLTVYDPNDIARTTIKETTEVNKMETQIKGATKLTVYDPNDVARTTLKETLIHDTRTGNIDIERNKKIMDYNFASAKRTMKETTIDNIHHTNVSYNRGDGKGYLTANPFAPSTLKQLTSDKEYSGNVSSSVNNKGGYTSNKFYAPATNKQFTSDNEYTGSAGSSANVAPSSYENMLNAETNSNKEKIAQGRVPTQTGVKVAGSIEAQGGVSYNKQHATYNGRKRSNLAVVGGGNISSNREGINNITKPGVPLSNKNLEELINPNNLNQLCNNPYNISINPTGCDNDTDTDSYFDGIF